MSEITPIPATPDSGPNGPHIKPQSGPNGPHPIITRVAEDREYIGNSVIVNDDSD